MKYNYCPECDKAYMKSRLEKDRCIFCGNPCKLVEVKRSGQYYWGYALMVTAAVVILMARFLFHDDIVLFAGGILLVIWGAATVLDANSKMAKKAAEQAKAKGKTGQKST